MRPRRAQGRPGTAVIPAGWAVSHRPVVEKTQATAITLRHPGTTQEWSQELEQNVEVPLDPYFTGTARVQALATQARPIVTVGDREVVAQYLVTIPVDTGAAEPAELDLVAVSDSGDPALDGRTLLVAQVVRGSLLFERDLFCTLDV